MLVEFALSIPVVLLVLFAVMDFGRALYTYDLVTSAAIKGVRYALVRGSACTAGDPCTATQASIAAYVQSVVTGVDSTKLSVTTSWPATATCPGGSPTPGCPVLVTVSYPFLFVLSFNTPFTMTGSSEMVISR